MIRSLFLAVLACLALGSACAQSNVEVWGQLDLGVRRAFDGSTRVDNGSNSRLGFRGREDLGGGLQAQFNLEHRFSMDTGLLEANGTRPFWQGRSTVGLSGSWGSIDLGRWVSPIQAHQWRYDANKGYGVGDLAGTIIVANFDTEPQNPTFSRARLSNGAFYNSPAFFGFRVMAMVGATEPIGSSGTQRLAHRPVGATLSFASSGVDAYVGWERNSLDNRNIAVGLAYDFKVVKAFGHYTKSNYKIDADRQALVLGLDTPVGAVGRAYISHSAYEIGASTVDTRNSVGYAHNLSRRTALYTNLSRQEINAVSRTLYDVGIQHKF